MEQIMLSSIVLGSFFNHRNGLIVALALGVLSFILIVSFIILYFMKRKDDTKDIIEKSIYGRGRIYDAVKTMVLEDDYITELELSDKNGKSIPYKESTTKIIEI